MKEAIGGPIALCGNVMVSSRFAKPSRWHCLEWIIFMSFPLFTRSFHSDLCADRHAKKEVIKQVRGVRGIERSVASNDHPVSETVMRLLFSSTQRSE